MTLRERWYRLRARLGRPARGTCKVCGARLPQPPQTTPDYMARLIRLCPRHYADHVEDMRLRGQGGLLVPHARLRRQLIEGLDVERAAAPRSNAESVLGPVIRDLQRMERGEPKA